MKSNLSVGLPIDLVVYKEGAFRSEDVVCIDESNPYFGMIHGTWGERLREVFESIENPQWGDGPATFPLRTPSARHEPIRKITHPGEKIV